MSADALRDALVATHAAVYLYGIVGGQCDSTDRPLAAAGFAAHRGWRDRLATLLRDAGDEAPASAPGYQPEFVVNDGKDAIRLAIAVEKDCAAAYERLVVAATDAGLRATGAAGLIECATRSAAWQRARGKRTIESFPGRG